MEYEEIIKKYGDVVLNFESYYKYKITYSGEVDGKKIKVGIGRGEPDDLDGANLKLNMKLSEFYFDYIELDNKLIYESIY